MSEITIRQPARRLNYDFFASQDSAFGTIAGNLLRDS